jgi:ABC-type glycerol-3-phosphate transport system substrate-binding protein
LQNEVVGGFEKLYKCKVYLVNYETNENLNGMFAEDSAVSQISLVSVPFELMESLAEKQKMTPLSDIVTESVLQFDIETYYYKFSDMGNIDEKYYYLPHRVEVPVLFYLKSKVADAQGKYLKYEKEIDDALKFFNGFGLPDGYVLEENPNEWDLYDIFVIGYIFSNEEYGEKKHGRILWRGNENGKRKNLFSGKENEEINQWEKIFGEYEIFNELSYLENYSAVRNYNAIKDGEIFMSYFLQKDCFNVSEGTDESQMQPYISDLSDIGIALIPSAVFFSLDKDGNTINAGQRIPEISGFCWGIPKNSKEKELAYLFVQYLNNRDINTKKTIRFGAIPVREDVFLNVQNIYDEKWLGEGYTTALYQIINFFEGKKEK